MIFKKREAKLSKYPCDVHLSNALRFITEKEYDGAYSEICWAIKKSGGELTKEQLQRLAIIIADRTKEC